MTTKFVFLLLFLLPFIHEDPVIPGDFADPSIIRRGDVYYAAGTSSEWAPHFPLFQSTDLTHWKPMGYAFDQTPAWAAASFWAPELFHRKGTYYLYYVARKKSDGLSCIGVATTTDLRNGFTDRGILLEYGKEAIDPFIFADQGQLYITWKAYGLDKRPIEILGRKLADDGLSLAGKPFSLLRDEARQGLEGQCLVKRNGYYYLLYSAGNCCGRTCSYNVSVARSTSVQGPYTPFSGNPILSETADWKCIGHGTLVTTKEGKDVYLSHAYSKTDDVYTGRQGVLSEVVWNPQTGWPALHLTALPSNAKTGFRDDFSRASLATNWQWDFRHTQPDVSQQGGNLQLAGRPTPDNPSGTVLTVRPLAGNYTITTEVTNRNASLKGLVLYGDADQSVGIGVKNDTVQVWAVRKGNRQLLAEKPLGKPGAVQLKMIVKTGYQLRFSWRRPGADWQALATTDAVYNADFLPPWDRSPRPGLLQQGNAKAPALFSFFDLTYS
jgi:beta-xylosidase